MLQKKYQLLDAKARSLPITHQEIIITDNHYQEEIEKARVTLKKVQTSLTKKSNRLQVARNKNSYLKQEISRIDHYIRFYLASPLHTTIPSSKVNLVY